MLLVSQNAEKYDIILPKDVVFRINLAWCNTINELEEKLSSNKKSEFFIDLPVGRIKPPNNRYTLDDIIPIIKRNPNVKFFAVSNVESKNDLIEFLEKLPNSVNIVPKIESPIAVQNIDEICNALKTDKKIVMLDHDDLFSSIIRNKDNKDSFQNYIKKLVDYCQENNIELLRTVGVVFSDDEKRITQYEK
jgi:citrate lyase beta subunit